MCGPSYHRNVAKNTARERARGSGGEMKSDYFISLVESMNLPKTIPREELDRVLEHKIVRDLKKTEHLLMAGEVPTYIGYVVSGLMRLYYMTPEGAEVTKHFCLENTLAISYSAFLQRQESKCSIQALEDTRLFLFDYTTYRECMDGHPCWQTFARRLAEMLFILKEKREEELLLCTAAQRYEYFVRDYPNLEQRLNQYQIASYLNITPESLSRIRSRRM